MTPLYGQGDAGRSWNRTLNVLLVKQGFARSESNPCLYIKHGHGGFWVHDIGGVYLAGRGVVNGGN